MKEAIVFFSRKSISKIAYVLQLFGYIRSLVQLHSTKLFTQSDIWSLRYLQIYFYTSYHHHPPTHHPPENFFEQTNIAIEISSLMNSLAIINPPPYQTIPNHLLDISWSRLWLLLCNSD